MTIQETRLKEMMELPLYKDFLAAGYTEEVRYPEISRDMLRSTFCEVGKPLSKRYYQTIDGEEVQNYIVEVVLIDTGIMHNNYSMLFSNYIFKAYVRISLDGNVDGTYNVNVDFTVKDVAAMESRIHALWIQLGSVTDHNV